MTTTTVAARQMTRNRARTADTVVAMISIISVPTVEPASLREFSEGVQYVALAPPGPGLGIPLPDTAVVVSRSAGRLGGFAGGQARESSAPRRVGSFADRFDDV